ncbi:MAG: DUF4365 domain-containing protein [Chitinophagales bacterium]|nr:DUF4365 domain-containing protein [Chitinophagales bacterium]
MQYPSRHNNHTLEQKSESHFRHSLPQGWTVTKPAADYGQDLNIEISEQGQMRGLDLIVQLKASAESNSINNNERIQLNTSTYNYLWDNIRVVMLVKFIESENEAYWILLKDVTPPNSAEQKEFTVYIPRQNRTSTINWENDIVNYVRDITHKKIKAVRPKK